MRLVLHYRGALKANGSIEHKHHIRQHFHEQLALLWQQPPLNEIAPFLLKLRDGSDYCLLRPLGDHMFVPLITAEMNVVAELRVVLLRPEPPGRLITSGGDIDNRLKTLFDALSMPRHVNALPTQMLAGNFYCLLEDDNLVTAVNVTAEQLLEPGVDPNTVDVTVHVQTRVTRTSMDNDLFW